MKQYADSCVATNEQFESALGDRDAKIISLTSKIGAAEVVREQLGRLERENEELRGAHEGHLHAQAEFEV